MKKPVMHSIWLVLVLSVLSCSVSAGTLGDLTYRISDGEVTITDCKASAEGELVIPNKIEGLPVTSIGDYAFDNCESLTSISIPDSVTSIGRYAFEGCRRLTSITIPEGVTSIGDYAFSRCSRLTSIAIPEGVTSIGGWAFYMCISLKSITIPDSVTSIGNAAFYMCTSLTSITIPDSVTSIGDVAFNGCSSLTEITIPEGVISIGGWAFSGCSSLTSIAIPEGVTSIGDEAFAECSSLTSITIPEAFHSQAEANRLDIGHLWPDGFFLESRSGDLTYEIADGQVRIADCDEAAEGELTIPSQIEGLPVTSIGDRAFDKCRSLTSITVPEGVTSIGDKAFVDCSSLTSIIVPEGVTSIGYAAFEFCMSLPSITIPEGVTSIWGYAFNGCTSLAEITIPQAFHNEAEANRLSVGHLWPDGFFLPGLGAAYSSAKATAVLTNGFVVGAEITDGGANYGEIPVVTITGGGGTGAEAVAVLTDGRVTSIEMINAGRGYTSEPTITIEPPIVPPTQVSLRMVPAITITGDVRYPKTIEVADTPDGPWTEWRTVVIGEEGTTEVDLDEGAEKRFYRVRD